MKKIKLGLIAATAACAALALTSCKGANEDDGIVDQSKDTIEVGILQIVTHDALNKATAGFKSQLMERAKDSGKTINFTYKCPEGNADQLGTMATQLVRSCDLVLGNATPAATQLVAARFTEGKKLPVLFTSVTDPVDAQLVSSLKDHPESVTGTSDLNPISLQVDMIFDAVPSVDKIGFLYNVAESNSKVQCDSAISYLKSNKGFTDNMLETQTVSDNAGITAAVTKLCNDGCDFIYLPTDNMMASNMTTITNVTNEKHVPTMCGEASMVQNGGTFTMSISYEELGKITGDMAADIILNGKSAKEIDSVIIDDASKMAAEINTEAVANYGITLSDAFKQKYKIA